jgi:hypothetical protein
MLLAPHRSLITSNRGVHAAGHVFADRLCHQLFEEAGLFAIYPSGVYSAWLVEGVTGSKLCGALLTDKKYSVIKGLTEVKTGVLDWIDALLD